MQIFSAEFVNSVKTELEKLTPGRYITREQLCEVLSLSKDAAAAVTLVLSQPEFSAWESVRSRGVRLKKVAPTVEAPTVEAPTVETPKTEPTETLAA